MDLFRVTAATLVGYLHATRSGNKTAAHRPAHITLDIDGLLPFS